MSRVLLFDHSNADLSGEIPGLFKRAGCTVDVYARKGSWLLKNNSWDNWHRADADPARFAAGIKSFLSDTKPANQQSAVPMLVRHFSRSITSSLRNFDVGEVVAWVRNEGGRWRFVPRDWKILFATSRTMLADRVRRAPWLFKPLRALKRTLS
ncbi:MAG: hypothetical protein WDN09_01655 [bacterium]